MPLIGNTGYCRRMLIEFDPQKDARNIALHGISLVKAETLLSGFVLERDDARRDYGETRMIALGEIGGLEYVCIYAQRGEAARADLVRRAKRKERDVYWKAKAAHDAADQARACLGGSGGAER
jgi:uncharacterized DUF497 family protein